MKRLALVLSLVAVAACKKAPQPATTTDSTAMPAAAPAPAMDSAKMMDSTKMMHDTSKAQTKKPN